MCIKIGFLYGGINLFKIKRDTFTIWTKIYQISNTVFLSTKGKEYIGNTCVV